MRRLAAFGCLALLCAAMQSCSGGGSSLGSNTGGGNNQSVTYGTPGPTPTPVPTRGPTSSVIFPTPVPPTVLVYPNPGLATWGGVLVTPRSIGCDILNPGYTGPLVVTTSSPPTGSQSCTFESVVFGLPPPNSAVTHLGIDASRYYNGTIRFDVQILSPLVDHFVVYGDAYTLTFTAPFLATYIIPVKSLYANLGTLAYLPYALQISFQIVAPISPFQIQNGFTAGTTIAQLNNLIWAP